MARIALLAVAEIEATISTPGHHVVARATATSEAAIRARLVTWISDPAVDVVIVIGGLADAVAPRALAPLVTEPLPTAAEHLRWLAFQAVGSAAMSLSPQAGRCGTTQVFVVPTADAIAPAVLSALATTTTTHQVTTGTIATIGDLPPPQHAVELFDLRRGGRRGLWGIGAAAMALVVGLGAVAANVIERNERVAPRHHDDRTALLTTDEASGPTRGPPTRDAAAATRAAAAATRDTAAASNRGTATRAAAAATRDGAAASNRRTATRDVAAAARDASAPSRAGATSTDDAAAPDPTAELCDAETCALHGNERECCAPFRPHATTTSLERTDIAAAIAAVKPAITACAAAAASDGSVRIAVTVAPIGRVSRAMVEEAPEAEVGQCIVTALRSATFPATLAGGSFVYRYEVPAVMRGN